MRGGHLCHGFALFIFCHLAVGVSAAQSLSVNGQDVAGSYTNGAPAYVSYSGATVGQYVCVNLTTDTPDPHFLANIFFPGVSNLTIEGSFYGSRSCGAIAASSGQIEIDNTRNPAYKKTFGYTIQLSEPSLPYAGGGGIASNGVTNSGSISGTNVDLWTFSAQQNDNVTIQFPLTNLQNCNSDFCAQTILVNPDGTFLFESGAGGGPGGINYIAHQSGTYYLYVFSQLGYYGPTSGSYSFTVSGTSSITPTPIDTLDPVPDLLDGSQITTDTSLLSSAGRPVQGIAADGVAQLVFRIPVQATNDKVTATLMSGCTNPAAASTCTQSTSTSDDGGLYSINNPVGMVGAASNTATDTADTTVDAFIAYRAPIDFVRNNSETDVNAASRNVYVVFSYTSEGTNAPYYVSNPLSITIVRPPVVLIHGYASNAQETWGSFSVVTKDPRFSTSLVNYGDALTVSSTSPQLGLLCGLGGDCVTNIRQSDLGFTVNTVGMSGSLPDPAVDQQITDYIERFDLDRNPSGQPVAGIQADIIAHSMGGLIARNWTVDKANYLTNNSFGAGYIHKLITLGTPHLGSPFATLALMPTAQCTRNLAVNSPYGQRVSISSATLITGQDVPGAVGELDGDGVGNRLNDALKRVNSSSMPLPTATIAGVIDRFGSFGSAVVFFACAASLDPVAIRFNPPELLPFPFNLVPQLFNTAFDPFITPEDSVGLGEFRRNDGAVPLTSALHDPNAAEADCDSISRFCDYAHGGSTQVLTGAGDNLVSGSSAVTTQVLQLLNTPITNTNVWRLQ